MSKISVSTTELSKLLHSAQSPVVIDVCKKPAFKTASDALPEATWRNHKEVATRAKTLPRDRRIVAYCVHGHEASGNGCGGLRDLGFDACFLEGGIESWKQAGLQLTRSTK